MTYQAGRSVATWEIDASRGDRTITEMTQRLLAFEKVQQRVLARQQQPGSSAPTRQITDQEVKLQQALARTAEAEARRAAATARKVEVDARAARATAQAALVEQREQTEAARTAAANERAALAAIRRREAEDRLANRKPGPTPPPEPTGRGGGSGIGDSALTLAKGFITFQALSRGFDLVRIGAQAADARRSLDGLAASANTTGQAILTSLRSAAQGTIRDSQLIQSANTGILLTQGRITNELPRLVEIARASAKATGQEVGFIFDSLTRGIARGSPLIIDNAGITLNAAQAFEEYAQSIGKSSDELNKSEQQQATLNAVLKSGDEIVRQVGLDANSSASKIDQAVTAVQNLGDALAQRIAPFLGEAAGGLANLLNFGTLNPGTAAAGQQLQGSFVENATSYEDYAARIKDANAQIFSAFGDKPGDDPAGDALARQLYGLRALTPVEFEYAQALTQRGVAADAAIGKAREMAGSLGELGAVITAATTGDEELRQAMLARVGVFGDLVTGSDAERTALLDLIDARGQGIISTDEFDQKLVELVEAHDAAAEAAAQEAREQRNLERSFAETLPSANALLGVLDAIGSARGTFAALNRELRDTSVGIGGALGGALGGDTAGDINRRFGFPNRNKPRSGRASGLSGLDRSEIALAGDLVAQLDEVQRRLTVGNLTQQQRNQLLLKQEELQGKINDALAKERDLQIDIALAGVKNEQARLKEARELAGLRRAEASGRFSGDQLAAIQLRQQEIVLEQQKRENDLAEKRRQLGETQADLGSGAQAERVASAQAAAQQAQAVAEAQQRITPQVPIPNVPGIPPPPSSVIVNLSITVDKTGQASVTAIDPGVVLNLLSGKQSQANLSGTR